MLQVNFTFFNPDYDDIILMYVKNTNEFSEIVNEVLNNFNKDANTLIKVLFKEILEVNKYFNVDESKNILLFSNLVLRKNYDILPAERDITKYYTHASMCAEILNIINKKKCMNNEEINNYLRTQMFALEQRMSTHSYSDWFISPYLNIENSTSIILRQFWSPYGSHFPYFYNNLLSFYSFFSPYAACIENPEDDIFIREICNYLHYYNISKFNLVFDYSIRNYFTKVSINYNENDSNSIVTNEESLGECMVQYILDEPQITIKLFMQAIKDMALSINIDPNILLIVVYIHELVHFVYFSGKFLFGLPFCPVVNEYFDIHQFGTDDFHEAYAQYITYLVIRDDKLLLEVFERLCKKQDSVYYNWKKMTKYSGYDIGKILMNANMNKTPKNFANYF